MKDQDFFCSWSGGKDSCLSLYRALKAGGQPRMLLTMFTEGGIRSRSHGLEKSVIEAQARSLGIPLEVKAASWGDYEQVFLQSLQGLKGANIDVGVFGDIDIEEHRTWVVDLCNQVGVVAYLPLWQVPRADVLREFIDAGFTAIIVAVNGKVMDKRFLGKKLNNQVIEELVRAGIDPCGENGEFHTVVVDGPIFAKPLDYSLGQVVLKDGYWFIDIRLEGKAMIYKVIKDHITSYPTPITLSKGETVIVGEQSSADYGWANWVYCYKADKSLEGWVPAQIISDEGIVLEDYSARELNVQTGETLIKLRELNGWFWVQNKVTLEEGWLPEENLEPLAPS